MAVKYTHWTRTQNHLPTFSTQQQRLWWDIDKNKKRRKKKKKLYFLLLSWDATNRNTIMKKIECEWQAMRQHSMPIFAIFIRVCVCCFFFLVGNSSSVPNWCAMNVLVFSFPNIDYLTQFDRVLRWISAIWAWWWCDLSNVQCKSNHKLQPNKMFIFNCHCPKWAVFDLFFPKSQMVCTNRVVRFINRNNLKCRALLKRSFPLIILTLRTNWSHGKVKGPNKLLLGKA